MRIPIITLSLSVFLLFISFVSFSQTPILGGDVYGNWSVDGSPYQVMGDITIPNDSTLAIDPGVMVEFQGHYALYVQGRLLALGTETDTILFTINDTTGFFMADTSLGGWYGIKIADTPEQNDTSKIMFCKLQFGKAVGPGWWLNAGGAICVVNFSKVIISNNLITHNLAGGSESEVPSGGGIHIAWSDVLITDNTISYNRAIAGGAIQIHDAHPIFANNSFIGNMAQEGGGISTGEIADISFNGDSFINNTAASHGGGIMVWNPVNWSFTNVTFSGNMASWGAGLGLNGGNVSVNNCSFENNKAYGIGGGIAADFCELIITNSTFFNDTSLDISGALHNWHCETEITNCSFLNNSANLGGGIYADFSSLELVKCNFTGNGADAGGALRFWSSNVSIDSVLFQQNHVTNQGGAIEYTVDTAEFTETYVFKLEKSQFIENTADFRCGAISFEQINSDTSLVDITIDDCEFTENHAERIGAMRIIGNISSIDISNSKYKSNSSDLWTGCMTISNGGTGTISNCLFFYNSAGSGSSGAAGSSNSANINYINCTFVGNSAVVGGALGLRGAVTSNVINSIFWGNSPNQISLTTLNDTIPCQLFLNYCDIQDGQDSISIDTVSVVHWGDGNINTQPLFEDILNDDFSLSSLSPCLGVGIDTIQVEGSWYTCPAVDLMGNPRPNPLGTMPDLGAIESALPDTSSTIDIWRSTENVYDLKNYPNPFNKNTTITFSLQESSMVIFSIINYLGEEIELICSERLSNGSHSYKWDASNTISGIYFSVLKTEDHVEINKMIVIQSIPE